MIRACVLLLAGFFAPQLISFDQRSDLMAAALVASVIVIFVPLARGVAWILAGTVLFIATVQGVVDARLDPALAGDSIVVDVVVRGFPRQRRESVAFVATPISDDRLPSRIRVAWFRPPVQLRNGDRWRLELRLRRPRGTANPGAFDYESWLTREAIGATGYVADSFRNQLLAAGPSSRLDALRQHFVQRVAAVVEDREAAAVLAAVVVGARHLLSDAQWERYARTGTSHLMAISGLHIGLAASGGYVLTWLLLAALRRDGNQHVTALVIAVLVALLYALVSGMAVPARRAVMMLGLAVVAVHRRQRPLPARVVAATCIVVALLTPLATMAPGFLLSFAAVVALLWLARRRFVAGTSARPARRIVARGAEAIYGLGVMQLMLFCSLLPLTALLFGRIAVLAPPINLLAVPVFTFVVAPAALLGFLLDGPMRYAGDFLLCLAGAGIGLLERLFAVAASLNWSAIDAPMVSGAVVFLLLLPTLWALLPPAWPCRSIGWLAALAVLLHVPAVPPVGCVEVRVLDVGQGLAALVRTHTTALLYDTGPSYRGGRSAAGEVVLPLLARLRIGVLDQLVVTHSDTDHAGGVETVLDSVRVGDLIVGEPLPQLGRQQQRCHAGLGWRVDQVRFEFLHPETGATPAGNDASCVLEITAGNRRLLLTGDIERVAEASLLEHDRLRPVDVVTVPHHGSRTSSTGEFVERLKPKIAIVTNAFGNRWDLPKPEIAARWRSAGAELLQTATSGAIRISFCSDSDELRVRQHRVARHRIWLE